MGMVTGGFFEEKLNIHITVPKTKEAVSWKRDSLNKASIISFPNPAKNAGLRRGWKRFRFHLDYEFIVCPAAMHYV
jgi:hypothetical protein